MRAISSFSLEAGISTFWWRALIALRMRVSMSATGSVNLIVLLLLRCPFAPRSAENLRQPASLAEWSCHSALPTNLYQDDFETPGISPRKARLRKHRRQSPNLRRNARGRPHTWQRLCLREENLGFLASFTRFAVVAMYPFKSSHEMHDSFIRSIGPERHSQMLQQSPSLVIGPGCSHNGDVHALLFVDFRVINFREDQLVVQSEGVIAPAIERLRGHSTEVTHPGQHHADQPVIKFVHAVAAQGDHGANWHAFAYFESGDRFLGPRGHRLLAGNLTQFVSRRIHELGVLGGIAHPHVDYDLVQTRYRHRILEIEFLHQRGSDFLMKTLFQPRRLFGAVMRDCRRFRLLLLALFLSFFFFFRHDSVTFSHGIGEASSR